MEKATLIIEMGKFTKKQGLEVYERFKHEVDEQWKKLQETQIRKSFAVGSRKAIEEHIVVKALDKFLTPLSAKEELEMKTGQNIPPFLFKVLTQIDEDYAKEELQAMCQEKHLPVSGDKKTLALRLLRYELDRGGRD